MNTTQPRDPLNESPGHSPCPEFWSGTPDRVRRTSAALRRCGERWRAAGPLPGARPAPPGSRLQVQRAELIDTDHPCISGWIAVEGQDYVPQLRPPRSCHAGSSPNHRADAGEIGDRVVAMCDNMLGGGAVGPIGGRRHGLHILHISGAVELLEIDSVDDKEEAATGDGAAMGLR